MCLTLRSLVSRLVPPSPPPLAKTTCFQLQLEMKFKALRNHHLGSELKHTTFIPNKRKTKLKTKLLKVRHKLLIMTLDISVLVLRPCHWYPQQHFEVYAWVTQWSTNCWPYVQMHYACNLTLVCSIIATCCTLKCKHMTLVLMVGRNYLYEIIILKVDVNRHG